MYMFSFSFSEVFSVKYQSESLAELEVNVFGNKSASTPPYLFLDFQFPAQEKSLSFSYKAH